MLGYRIAFLRIKKGISQAELGRRLGVSASAVGMYEQGRRAPSLDIVVRLAQEFDVTTDYLLTGNALDRETKENLNETALTMEEILHIIRIIRR